MSQQQQQINNAREEGRKKKNGKQGLIRKGGAGGGDIVSTLITRPDGINGLDLTMARALTACPNSFPRRRWWSIASVFSGAWDLTTETINKETISHELAQSLTAAGLVPSVVPSLSIFVRRPRPHKCLASQKKNCCAPATKTRRDRNIVRVRVISMQLQSNCHCVDDGAHTHTHAPSRLCRQLLITPPPPPSSKLI